MVARWRKQSWMLIFFLITCLRFRYIIVRRSQHGRAIGIARRIVASQRKDGEERAFQREEKSRSHKTCSKSYEIAKRGLKHARDTRSRFRNHCVSWFIQINRPCRPDSTTRCVSICEAIRILRLAPSWQTSFALVKEKSCNLSLLYQNLIIKKTVFTNLSRSFCFFSITALKILH